MSPTVVRDGPFRMFFFSREERRPHVHVSHPDGEAKFWIEPGIELGTQIGLTANQIRDARSAVERHLQEIRDAWYRHFGR
jgi:ribosomal protein L16/L10AE